MDNNKKDYDLTEEQWKRIEPLLPPENAEKKGLQEKGNRKMMNGMLRLNYSGAHWRKIPKSYGPWQSIYSRFAKWRDKGLWETIFLN